MSRLRIPNGNRLAVSRYAAADASASETCITGKHSGWEPGSGGRRQG